MAPSAESGKGGTLASPSSTETMQVQELCGERLQSIAQLGEGGEARVFSALLDGTMTVAVKQLVASPQLSGTQLQIAFCREVEALSKLSGHPNILKLIGITSCQRPWRIVTELCEGGSLFELLHDTRAPLTWSQRCKIGLDVASALVVMHSQSPPLVHRDLKSMNILLTQRFPPQGDAELVPVVKLADFGLARTVEQQEDTEEANEPSAAVAAQEGTPAAVKASLVLTRGVGTPHWTAPEVHFGNAYRESADVYSFGMVLYEVLCNAVPFESLEPAHVMAHVILGRRPPLDALLEGYPQPLSDLMIVCGAQKPALRPSAKKCHQVLSGVMEELR